MRDGSKAAVSNQISRTNESASRHRLQLSTMNPAVLAVGSFDAVPVSSYDQDHDFCACFQRLHVRSAVEWSRLQLPTRSFDHPLSFVTQVIEMLVQRLRCGLGRGQGRSFVGRALAFQFLSG